MAKGRYQSHYRIHGRPHALDLEEGKIRRETASYLKLSASGERALQRLLRQGGAGELEDAGNAIAVDLAKAKRERRNAKEHKRRLAVLDAGREAPPVKPAAQRPRGRGPSGTPRRPR